MRDGAVSGIFKGGMCLAKNKKMSCHQASGNLKLLQASQAGEWLKHKVEFRGS